VANGAREAFVACEDDILRRRCSLGARGATVLCSATQVASAAPASAGSSRQSAARECTKRRRAEIAICDSQLKFL